MSARIFTVSSTLHYTFSLDFQEKMYLFTRFTREMVGTTFLLSRFSHSRSVRVNVCVYSTPCTPTHIHIAPMLPSEVITHTRATPIDEFTYSPTPFASYRTLFRSHSEFNMVIFEVAHADIEGKFYHLRNVIWLFTENHLRRCLCFCFAVI